MAVAASLVGRAPRMHSMLLKNWCVEAIPNSKSERSGVETSFAFGRMLRRLLRTCRNKEFRNWTNPASQIRDLKSKIGLAFAPDTVQFQTSDLRFRTRPISKFPDIR